MAYKCGYIDGYNDNCVGSNDFCGGGYAGVQYAAGPYGGILPCIGFVPSNQEILSNVEDLCIQTC
jgi:hypothetical protein